MNKIPTNSRLLLNKIIEDPNFDINKHIDELVLSVDYKGCREIRCDECIFYIRYSAIYVPFCFIDYDSRMRLSKDKFDEVISNISLELKLDELMVDDE